MQWPDRVWVIGCGNMGGAILNAWLDDGLPPEQVTIIDPRPSYLPDGVAVRADVPVGTMPDLIMLAVKPQMIDVVATVLADAAGPRTSLVSIMAGIEAGDLRRYFPSAGSIIRLMPNMAVSIGRSPMLFFSTDTDPALRRRMNDLFHSLGSPEWLEDEHLMHIATSLSGSGPAFVFRFIDSLARSAAKLGMDEAQAARLALSMVEGAALLAAQSEDPPGVLADRVASPGGGTREGLNVLDADGRLDGLLYDVLKAATDRYQAIAAEAKG
jgi:pyrroline-5-carboxylate reductase